MPFAHVEEDFCDLEQAKHRFNWGQGDFLISVENEMLGSCEELVQLAKLDCYRNREFLEVRLIPIAGGG